MVVWVKKFGWNEPAPFYVAEPETVKFLATGIQFYGIYEILYFCYEDVEFITSTLEDGYKIIKEV